MVEGGLGSSSGQSRAPEAVRRRQAGPMQHSTPGLEHLCKAVLHACSPRPLSGRPHALLPPCPSHQAGGRDTAPHRQQHPPHLDAGLGLVVPHLDQPVVGARHQVRPVAACSERGGGARGAWWGGRPSTLCCVLLPRAVRVQVVPGGNPPAQTDTGSASHSARSALPAQRSVAHTAEHIDRTAQRSVCTAQHSRKKERRRTRVVVHAVDPLFVPLQRHVGRGVAQAPHLRSAVVRARGAVRCCWRHTLAPFCGVSVTYCWGVRLGTFAITTQATRGGLRSPVGRRRRPTTPCLLCHAAFTDCI